jgi:hypothetical protein
MRSLRHPAAEAAIAMILAPDLVLLNGSQTSEESMTEEDA